MASIRLSNAGGAWGTGATWDGGVAPAAGDDATADSASGNLSIATNVACHSFDSTGWLGTLTVSGARTLTVGGGTTLTTAAVFKLGSGCTFTGGGTFTFQCDNRSGGLTITTNGVVMNGITTFNTDANVAASVTVTCADSCNIGAATVTYRRGGFTQTSSTTFTTTGNISYTGTTGTYALTYTSATISCGSWSKTGAGTLSLTGGSGTITQTGNAQSFTGGAITYPGTVTINGGGVSTLGGANTFNNLSLIGDTTTTSGFQGASQTISGVLTITGNATNQPTTLANAVYGTAITFTVNGSVALTNVNFRDITTAGTAGTWTGTSLGNGLGNTGITFTTPKTVYWVGVAGSWSANAATGWATSSGGTPALANYPIPQDSVIIDSNSLNSQTLTIDDPNICAFDASGDTHANTITVNTGTANNFLYGDIALSANTTFNITTVENLRTAKRSATQKWTSNGGTINPLGGVCTLNIQNISGTFQPQDDFNWNISNTTAGVVIINGTLNPLGNFTVPYLIDSGTATKAFTGTSGKTLTLTTSGSSGTMYQLNQSGTTVTLNAVNLSITQTTGTAGTVFTNGTMTFSNLSITGGGTGVIGFSQGTSTTLTFANITIGAPKSISWPSHTVIGVTCSITFDGLTAIGTSGNLITMNSTLSGTDVTFGWTGKNPVSCNYISLKDNNASTSVSPLYEGVNSVDVSNNTNWNPGQGFDAASGTTMNNYQFTNSKGDADNTGVMSFSERIR